MIELLLSVDLSRLTFLDRSLVLGYVRGMFLPGRVAGRQEHLLPEVHDGYRVSVAILIDSVALDSSSLWPQQHLQILMLQACSCSRESMTSVFSASCCRL
jgi:hypothetical protein